MHVRRAIAVAAATVTLTGGALVGSVQTAGASGSNVLFGSFIGSTAMQQWQGRGDAVGLMYAGWNDTTASIKSQMLALWNNQHTVPDVSWYLLNSNTGNAQIASGASDAHLLPYVTMFKSFLAGPDGTYGNGDDRRLYLRPDWEANGTWYGYSPAYGNPSASVYKANVATFKAMWTHLHNLFTTAGVSAPDIQWVFSPSSHDSWYANSNHIAEDIYPGDSVVDWIGLDGYNFGTPSSFGWETPDQVFDDMIGRMQALAPTKPIGVTETGCTTDGSTVAAKAAWITSYFSWLRSTAGPSSSRRGSTSTRRRTARSTTSPSSVAPTATTPTPPGRTPTTSTTSTPRRFGTTPG
jgi:hypothetical protein